jgi:uncharacterized protein YlxW (UPF0749 family)
MELALSLLKRYWKPLAALIVLLSMLAYAHHAGAVSERQKWEAKVSQARQSRLDEYERLIVKAKASQAKAEADTADLSGKLADAQSRTEALQKALARASMVTHAPSQIPGCPAVPRLGRDFRLLFNAAVDGTAPIPANP